MSIDEVPRDPLAAIKFWEKKFESESDRAAVLVRQMRNTPNPDARAELIAKLRTCDAVRFEAVLEMDKAMGK